MFRFAFVAGAAAVTLATPWTLAAEGTQPSATRPAISKQVYTCPMHPEIRWTRPDKCPICGMKLVAKASASSAPERPMPNHAGMSMNHLNMQHDHHGMGSMMMGGGCSMCMEMMGMGNMNGQRTKIPRPAAGSARSMSQPHSSGGGSRGCGC